MKKCRARCLSRAFANKTDEETSLSCDMGNREKEETETEAGHLGKVAGHGK